MSRLAAAAGITCQHQLLGSRASRAEVTGTLRQAAGALDPRGHLMLTFTGHSDRERISPDRPPEVAWCLADGTLPLSEVAALLAAVPPTVFITVIADTCYAAALSRFTIPATVVLLAACGPDQEILANPATGFAARLERLMLADGQPNPACTSYLWLGRQFRRDSPEAERPQVWTNRPSVWSQRPLRHPAAPPPARLPTRPPRSALLLISLRSWHPSVTTGTSLPQPSPLGIRRGCPNHVAPATW
jgi:hypothetical protein